MSLRISKKGFTLVEMLIVIVIIGILAAALIPRILSVQARARDTKRKADIGQIGSALAIYKADYTTLRALTGFFNSDDLKRPLVSSGSYMSSMPRDTISTSWEGMVGESGLPETATGNYAFTVFERDGKRYTAFGLMARTENHGTSNRVYILDGFFAQAMFLHDTVANYGPPCRRILKTTEGAGQLNLDGDCSAAGTELRYIYVQ